MKCALALLAAVFLTGCFTVTAFDSSKTPGKTVTKKNAYFIDGLVGTRVIDTSLDCPKGVAKIVETSTFGDQMLGCCTFGIYTPRHYTLTCAE